jgi:hypothetical protein
MVRQAAILVQTRDGRYHKPDNVITLLSISGLHFAETQ